MVALARLIGGDSLAADPRLTSAAGRKAHEDELEALVAAWARGKPAGEAEAMLQAAGVPAHVVATSEEFCADPQIAALAI